MIILNVGFAATIGDGKPGHRDPHSEGAAMSLFKKVSDFAKSEQGRKYVDQAKRYASDPKNKQKIDQVKNRFMGKGRGSN